MMAAYFLTPEEKELFQNQGWSLNWPAIKFSTGAEKKGAALATSAIRRRRSSGKVIEYPFPCIVLTGLGYKSLVKRTLFFDNCKMLLLLCRMPIKRKCLCFMDANRTGLMRWKPTAIKAIIAVAPTKIPCDE
jgi:hypothetical protein